MSVSTFVCIKKCKNKFMKNKRLTDKIYSYRKCIWLCSALLLALAFVIIMHSTLTDKCRAECNIFFVFMLEALVWLSILMGLLAFKLWCMPSHNDNNSNAVADTPMEHYQPNSVIERRENFARLNSIPTWSNMRLPILESTYVMPGCVLPRPGEHLYPPPPPRYSSLDCHKKQPNCLQFETLELNDMQLCTNAASSSTIITTTTSSALIMELKNTENERRQSLSSASHLVAKLPIGVPEFYAAASFFASPTLNATVKLRIDESRPSTSYFS